jgi:hypothetical protein
VVVSTSTLDEALAALDAAGIDAVRATASLRVLHAKVGEVRDALDAAAVSADLGTSPATFEEAFVQLVAPAIAG